jgi:hypothetical protein
MGGVKAIALLLCLLMGSCHRGRATTPDGIEYRGVMFKMKRAYETYEDYKDDPDNLAPGEAARAAQVVRSASVPKQFDDRRTLIHGMFDLVFPGYGLGAFGERAQPDGSVLSGHAIELPQSGNSRILVYRGVGGHYVLVDDFVESDDKAIMGVRAEGKKLIYTKMNGQTVLTREAR